MHSTLYQLYSRTLRKYLKFSSRLEKGISNGTFFKKSEHDQNTLVRRVERLKQKLEHLKLQLKLAAAGLATTLIMTTADVNAQSPGLGPFIEQGRLDNPLRPPIQFPKASSDMIDIDNDGDLDLFVGEDDGSVHFFRNYKFDPIKPLGHDAFAEPSVNPYSNFQAYGVYTNSTIAFADIDGDGDRDAVVGFSAGSVPHLFFEYDAGAFQTPVSRYGSPFGFILNGHSRPHFEFGNFDGDADLEAFVGSETGAIDLIQWNGSNWVQDNATTNLDEIASGIAVPGNKAVALYDIDGDTFLDAFIGLDDGSIVLHKGTATPFIFNITEEVAGNPFNGIGFGQSPFPQFINFDGDSDLDLIVSHNNFQRNYLHYSSIRVFENNGSNVFSDLVGLDSPFGGIDVKYDATVTFTQIDGDSDLEVFTGGYDGVINFYDYQAALGFQKKIGASNPLNSFSSYVSVFPKVEFADTDNDGDLDAYVGTDYNGEFYYFQNTGTAASPNFVLAADNTNSLDLEVFNAIFSFTNKVYPTIGDIDNDGDLDAVVGGIYDAGEYHHFFENLNAPPSPPPVNTPSVFAGTAQLNGFSMGGNNVATLADLDHDGDLDLYRASGNGSISTFINDGAMNFSYYGPVDIANHLFDVNSVMGGTGDAVIEVVDIDNDGDLDIFVGNNDGQIQFFKNDNNPVSLDLGAGDLNYPENSGAVAGISVTITDPDSDPNTDIVQVFIKMNNYVSGEDQIVWMDQFNITGTFNPTGDELTLTGSDSFANYQTAVSSITYENISDDPDPTPRTIEYQAWDSDFTDPTVYTKTINVIPSNDPPTATTSIGALSYTENDGQVVIDPSFNGSDLDNTNMAGAVIQFSGTYNPGEDFLWFTNQNGITGNFNSGAGILTLSGSTTLANYITAIRSIAYENVSDDPDVSPRDISFTLEDGTDPSTPTFKNISLTSTNDLPQVSLTGGDINYFPGDPPTIIDGAMNVSDPDDLTLNQATVTISQNFVGSEDVLSSSPSGGISQSYAGGVLTLTGPASIADFITTLQSVTYENTNSSSPDPNPREINFEVQDASGGTSLIQSRNVNLGDNAPVLNLTSGSLNYTENDGAVIVDSGLTLTDDTPSLASATITLTGFVSSEDLLDFTSTGGITGSYNSGTGVLSLSGSATVADYQTVLQSITYENTSEDPSTSGRSVDIVVSDGFSTNTPVGLSISITAVNDAPNLTLNAVTASWTENDPAVTLDNLATVADPDNTNLTQITLTLTNFQNGEDELTSAPSGSVSGSFDAGTGTLTISGAGTITQYETVLRSVGYQNTSEDPNTTSRSISIVIDDGTDQSGSSTFTVNITAVNDAPVIGGSGTALDHTGGISVVDNTIVTSDLDNANIASAQVVITSGFQSGTDLLDFTAVASIAGSYDSATGILTLSGTGTVAEYSAVLQSVTYENTSGLDTSTRTIEFLVNDGTDDSNIFSRTINVNISDTPPVLTLTTSSFTYTENDGPQSIDPGITITDDSPEITGGLVSITTNFVNGDDMLNFIDQAGITGSYDAASGMLTLAGNASASEYETALSSLTYENTSENPASVTKTVEIQLDDGVNTSAAVSLDIDITPVNDPPQLAGSSTELSYRSLTGSVIVDDQITVTDVDDNDLVGAVISVASDYSSGEDVLEFTDQNGITGSFNTVTGVLSLSGTATKANYETALRSVAYRNDAALPSAASKNISFVISDQTESGTPFNRTVQIASNQVVAASIDTQVDLGGSITIDVIGQATFTSGDVITTSITGAPTLGAASVNPDGSIMYTPNNNAPNGAIDQITYELCNEFVSCGSNTIAITISNSAPVINIPSTNIQPGARATVSLLSGITDLNGNIDPSSIRIVEGPSSGLPATIDSDLNLIIDYSGSGFTGADHIIIEACDFSGDCTQFDVVIVVGEVNEVLVYQGVTPNNDGINDVLRILDIEFFPDNEIFIYNKIGKLVYTAKGYDNFGSVFSGFDNDGEELPDGTYYYVIILDDEHRQSGFFVLQR